MSPSQKPRARVTEIGEYIRHHSCERRFRLDNNNRRAVTRDPATRVPFAERLFNALDPVLQAAGRKREEEWEDSLHDAGLTPLLTTHGTAPDDEPAPSEPPRWEDFVVVLASLPVGEAAYAREIAVEAEIGGFHLAGRIDFVLVIWQNSVPRLRLVECKASRRDRTYHRIQVVLYRLIVQQLLREAPLIIGGVPLDPARVECVVARIDEATEQVQPILGLEPLPLELEEADTLRLLAEDGPLVQILATPLDALPYRIDTKCDGCVFSVHCLPESARQRRLELIGIEPSAVRALQAAGIATLDDLAELDLADPRAQAVQHDHGFTENLASLVVVAGARRSTLPRGASDPDEYPVQPIPYSGHGQLPRHEIDGARLVRVYLNVHYDYTENRLGALAAHVTTSERDLRTRFARVDGRWQPDPGIFESVETGRDAANHPLYDDQPLAPADVVEYVSSEWSGRYDADTGREQALIESFLRKLVEAIARVAQAESAPVHFYVWSRSEMTKLVEGCARASSRLLGSLRELLGCREPTEQLLFSCLEEEVDQRFGLGWTGRGLAVASSLTWFGQPYHWRRQVFGTVVNLDDVFTQDIHDFKTSLRLAPDGTWADPDDPSVPRHTFEIRSRFHDTLTAPYWRAVWDTLMPLANGRDARVRAAVQRYNEANRPGYLEAYLAARVHALRWIEERIRFKNDEIDKGPIDIAGLRRFSLGVNTTTAAAIDFLRLDHHVKVSQWLAEGLAPPAHRVPLGASIPLMDVTSHGANKLTATIDLSAYPLDRDTLESRTSYDEGVFVRVTPCAEDPSRGQTLNQLRSGGRTCTITAINWDTGHLELSAMYSPSSRYLLFSGPVNEPGVLFEHATLDGSPSDFVARRVESRLLTGRGAHVGEWLDPTRPSVPPQTGLDPARLAAFTRLLKAPGLVGGNALAPDQATACLDGLATRIQLLLGPPGTGKTMTTAAAILLRILARRVPGDIVLIGAHTHTALNTLLERIDRVLDPFREAARDHGLTLPPITLAKVHSSAVKTPTGGRIQDIMASSGCVTAVRGLLQGGVAIIGGTTSALLNMAEKLATSATLGYRQTGFHAPMLVVDEASMMVFPHFLALATLVEPDGEIMLAGDHRQLSPIVAHDWEHEDRPPTVLYQPFASAYDAVRNLLENSRVTEASVRRSALSYTFRLPAEIRELIARLYRLDDVELAGLERAVTPSVAAPSGAGVPPAVLADDPPHSSWESIWQEPTGLYLVLHDERLSKQSNPLEAAIIEEALAAAGELPQRSVGLVTPHRAQRSLLKTRLARFVDPDGPIDAVDTVERFQGGERPTIVVSATASDASAISARARFLLDLNRSNVAFSRAKQRLIVICSQSLLTHIPPEVEHYDSALLWKSLRAFCSRRLFTTTVNGHTVQVLSPPLESPGPTAR